ncbi:hypothetical protein AVEN_264630-1 [Araneus ventricosus]|uniref:Uncharacterized protein n=1 Tax=Araneus ventricosus TaxID=182803 RepID=A0A4Y2X0R5_ARAVE|nr:hypothetical protein AVEN_264630-1 [Araneus ventricosus]
MKINLRSFDRSLRLQFNHFLKAGSKNSEIDKDEEQSSSQDCPNFKRSKPDILGDEEEEIIPEQTDTTKITSEIPGSRESPNPSVTELLQKLIINQINVLISFKVFVS